MPSLHYWYLGDHDLVAAKLCGDLTLNDLIRFAAAQANDPAIPETVRALHDFRLAKIDFGYDDAHDFARAIGEAWTKGHARVAVLVTSPLLFGLARMTAALVDSRQFTFQAFYELPEALEWLGHPPDVRLPDPIALNAPPEDRPA
jgi:hypothetical protein